MKKKVNLNYFLWQKCQGFRELNLIEIYIYIFLKTTSERIH